MSKSRFGGFRIGKTKILNQWDIMKSSSTAVVTAPTSISNFDYSTAQGLWDLNSTMQFPKITNLADQLEINGIAGLAGKFFNGTWRTSLAAGTVGTLPLTTTNDSSNVTGTTGMPSAGHRYGVNAWSSIAYSTIGDTYGFIAVGYFKPPTTGSYTFYTSSDDYSGVWVGSIASAASGRSAANSVVNNGLGGTAGQGNTKRSGVISLIANTWYAIRVVHEEGGGGDNLTFSWSGPGIAETTDLTTYFKSPASGGVLTGNFIEGL